MVPCYQSQSRQYRHEMGGTADAGNLPSPSGSGVEVWHNAEKVFGDIWSEIEGAMRSAEAAHEGRAADAANASMEKMRPNFDGAKASCDATAAGLNQQADYQANAFDALPKEGESLENGRPVQIDPPQKGWVEDWGLDDNALTGWMSDYEERQEDFTSTNDRAVMAMERYDSQTQGVIDGLPREEQPPPPPPSEPPPSSNHKSADSQFGNSTLSTPGTPASSSSSSVSSTPTASPSAPAGSPGGVPAGSGSAWASPTPTPGPSTGTPRGTVRGPDGTLYRQDPKTGQWMRQNPYNGRWAVAPNGPGGAGGAGARGTPGAGSGMGARGGMAGGGGAGGASGGSQLGAGGRAGTGMPGAGGGAAGGGTAAGAGGGAGGAGGRGGGAAPMGGARGGGGGQGDEQEHDRPSWLLENDDVFTNDMDKVAPPVFGAPEEGQGR